MMQTLNILIICWVALNAISTVMPIPNEMQFFTKLPNSHRWLAFFVVLLALLTFKYWRYLSWNWLKNLLRIGISWKSGDWYFLGMTGSAKPSDAKITGFQLRGFNNTLKTMKSIRAYLILPNGDKPPLTVTSSSGLADYREISPRTTLWVNGSFGESRPADFIRKCTPFSFVFEWSGGEIRRRYSRRACERQINRFEKASMPKKDSFL